MSSAFYNLLGPVAPYHMWTEPASGDTPWGDRWRVATSQGMLCWCTLVSACGPLLGLAWLGHLPQSRWLILNFPAAQEGRFLGGPAQPVPLHVYVYVSVHKWVGFACPNHSLPHSCCPTIPDQFSTPALVNISTILYVHLCPLGWGRRDLITGRHPRREG